MSALCVLFCCVISIVTQFVCRSEGCDKLSRSVEGKTGGFRLNMLLLPVQVFSPLILQLCQTQICFDTLPKLHFLVLVAVVAIVVVSGKCPTAEGYSMHEGICVKMFKELASIDAATSRCETDDAHLIHVKSTQDQQALQHLKDAEGECPRCFIVCRRVSSVLVPRLFKGPLWALLSI